MAIKFTDIPTPTKWAKDSNVLLSSRSKDHILKRIDELIEAISKAPDAGARLYLVTDLFFTADYWLKIYKSNSDMENRREPAVMALYTCVVNELCAAFSCTVNVLPRELEYYFGREMGFHGAKLDLALDCASYLKRSEVRKYKLFFKGGLAYQFPWWDSSAKFGKTKFVLAESKEAYEPAVFHGAHRRHWGGFAMSMGRDLYMAKHHCKKGFGESGNFYHSSYLGGEHVLCAGTMLIKAGVIKGISTDSGHYRPSRAHIVNLLQALQMLGVKLNAIDVQDHLGHADICAKGDVFLASNGNWATAIARRQANLTHIVDRFHESAEFEKSIKALWEKSLAGGLFSDDMPGRVYFAGVLLPNYVNSSKQAPFRGINFIYALNALARATNRKPDAFEEWILGDWERYRRQYNVADILANRQVFAQFEASLPTVRGAGWDATMVLDLLKQAYQTRRLPWT